MKKIIYFLIFSCLAFSAYCSEHHETIVSGKKIITGVSQKEALDKFGIPTKGNLDFWHYEGIDPFYVYFSQSTHKPSFFVFPHSYNAKVGIPFEIKAFILYQNFHIEEVTEYVDWIITDKSITERKKNFFMPLKDGNTKILAAYRNDISNACNVFAAHPVKNKNDKGESLLAVSIFPHKPIVEKGQNLTFAAFGTFFNPRLKRISIRNISSDVTWFVQDKKSVREEQSNIYFMYPGKETIYCEYKDKKSDIQEITIREDSLRYREKIKNIRLLPDFAKVDKETEIVMEIIATYDDGKIEHVGGKSLWQIDDKNVIDFVEKGIIKSKKEGIAKVSASLDNLHHSFSKILVINAIPKKNLETDKANHSQVQDTQEKKEKQKKTHKGLIDNIKKTLQMLNPESIKIKSIKIIPKTVGLPLGRTIDFTAEAVYSDDSMIDATSFIKWKSTNPENATIERGKLLTHSRGKTAIYAYLDEIKSNSAEITITGPELVSIALYPQELKLETGKAVKLKATGHYSDSSEKNITNEAKWYIENESLLDIKKMGILEAKKRGLTNIYAQRNKIKSLPLTVKIFVSPLAVLKKVATILLLLCLGSYLLFYSLLKIKVNKLKRLILDNPSKFIKSLYANSKKVFKIFKAPYLNTVPALKYAKITEKRFSIKSNYLTNLTYKFSEAQYSKHTISSQDAIRALHYYNKSMEAVKKNSSGFLFKACLLLLRGYPFMI